MAQTISSKPNNNNQDIQNVSGDAAGPYEILMRVGWGQREGNQS